MHEFIVFANDMMSRPMFLVVLLCIFFLFFLRSLKLDFASFVTALNNIGSQPFALIVMVIGFWMLIESKKFGIDTTIAGAVIGVASNMLQAQIKDFTHPPGSTVKVDSIVQTPPTLGANLPEKINETVRQGRAYK